MSHRGQCDEAWGWPRRSDEDDDSDRHHWGLRLTQAKDRTVSGPHLPERQGPRIREVPHSLPVQGWEAAEPGSQQGCPTPGPAPPCTACSSSASSLGPSLCRWGNMPREGDTAQEARESCHSRSGSGRIGSVILSPSAPLPQMRLKIREAHRLCVFLLIPLT